MFKLKFGLLWTAFTTFVFAICVIVPAEERNGAEMSVGLFLFFSLFEIIGIWVIISGIRQIRIDHKTKKFGETAYGRIISISETGASSNGNNEYQAEVLTYLPSENATKYFKEIVGFDPIQYDDGDLVELKYYNNDINILQVVTEDQIPSHILPLIMSNIPAIDTEDNLENNEEDYYS